jgi:hypothetical protein
VFHDNHNFSSVDIRQTPFWRASQSTGLNAVSSPSPECNTHQAQHSKAVGITQSPPESERSPSPECDHGVGTKPGDTATGQGGVDRRCAHTCSPPPRLPRQTPIPNCLNSLPLISHTTNTIPKIAYHTHQFCPSVATRCRPSSLVHTTTAPSPTGTGGSLA